VRVSQTDGHGGVSTVGHLMMAGYLMASSPTGTGSLAASGPRGCTVVVHTVTPSHRHTAIRSYSLVMWSYCRSCGVVCLLYIGFEVADALVGLGSVALRSLAR
jgi:hypothetical protein